MYRPEVSRSAQSRSHTMAYTYRTRAQIPQLRARQSTNSALKQERNHRAVDKLAAHWTRAGTTLLKLIYLIRQFTSLKTLRFLWLIFVQTICLTQLQVGRPCLFWILWLFRYVCSLPGELNSIQMMTGGKLMANQTVRIVRDRTSVSVNENVRISHLKNGSNWKGRREWR